MNNEIDRNQELANLVSEMEELFRKQIEARSIVWTNIDQEKANERINALANIMDVFSEQSEKEKDAIKSDLTITDSSTGEEISLIDATSINNRVNSILNSNDIFSLCKALAVLNKCIHAKYLDGGIKSISTKIENLSTEVNQTNNENNDELHFDISELSNEEIESMLQILSKNSLPKKSRNRMMISVIKQLKIELNMETLEQDFLRIKGLKHQIVKAYIDKLQADKNKLQSIQADLYWIKDQYIIMIAQLLKSDPRYQLLKYELVQAGNVEGFQNMLAIDYPELSYYIEVHMPDFIANELVRTYGFDAPSSNRIFERLGASAVYERNEQEVEEIRKHMYDDINPESSLNSAKMRRRIIITRNRSGEFESAKKDSTYVFRTARIINNSDASVLEQYLVSDNVSRIEKVSNMLRYSKIRSNENIKDVEHEVQEDIVRTIINKKDELYQSKPQLASKYMNKIKSYIRKKIIKEKRFDMVLYMMAYGEDDDNFIKIMSKQKELSKKYYNEINNDDDILGIYKYITENKEMKFIKINKINYDDLMPNNKREIISDDKLEKKRKPKKGHTYNGEEGGDRFGR